MRSLIVAGLSSLAVVLPSAPTEASSGCDSHRCIERVARKRCERGEFRGCIRRAAVHRKQSYVDMLRVSYCESTWNRFAANGQYLGPFQFGKSTWDSTPYGRLGDQRTSWKWSSLAAAWMWQHHRRDEWECQ